MPAEPPICPPGWKVGPPDFVGVGADASGTSWWFRLIVSHPAVSTVPDSGKELHFFDGFWDDSFSEADVARYHAHFPRAEAHLSGEWTPRYMYDTWTPRLLFQCAPETRLLVSLRDPLERYRSAMRRIVADHRSTGEFPGPSAALALSRSLYTEPILRLLRHFPREQVLILQYERCVAEPERELLRTYEFLGAPQADFVPPRIGERVNPGPQSVGIPSCLEDGVVEIFARDVRRLLEIEQHIELDLWPSMVACPNST